MGRLVPFDPGRRPKRRAVRYRWSPKGQYYFLAFSTAALIAVMAWQVAPSARTIDALIDHSSTGDLVGRASVIDGDTIAIHGRRIRFHGIDAPEASQTCEDAKGVSYRCGQMAARALKDMIGWKTVQCIGSDTDQYGRIIASCFVDGNDLEAAMVEAGYAIAYVRYSRDYASDESQAKAARRGLWAGSFQAPEIYRHGG